MVSRKDTNLRIIEQLVDALQEFKNINPNMSVQQIMAFLTVALNEGLSLKEIADLQGMKIPTLSRIFIDLGFRNRNMEPGYNIVESRQDPMELRKNQYTLSKRGQHIVDKLVKKLS